MRAGFEKTPVAPRAPHKRAACRLLLRCSLSAHYPAVLLATPGPGGLPEPRAPASTVRFSPAESSAITPSKPCAGGKTDGLHPRDTPACQAFDHVLTIAMLPQRSYCNKVHAYRLRVTASVASRGEGGLRPIHIQGERRCWTYAVNAVGRVNGPRPARAKPRSGSLTRGNDPAAKLDGGWAPWRA